MEQGGDKTAKRRVKSH